MAKTRNAYRILVKMGEMWYNDGRWDGLRIVPNHGRWYLDSFIGGLTVCKLLTVGIVKSRMS
jgi:hypothetical protein